MTPRYLYDCSTESLFSLVCFGNDQQRVFRAPRVHQRCSPHHRSQSLFSHQNPSKNRFRYSPYRASHPPSLNHPGQARGRQRREESKRWYIRSSSRPALAAAAAVTAAHAGTPVHDAENDSFSATLRCHDANGELYNLVFSRDRVTLQSYSDDAILGKVETWADNVPALA